MKTITLMCLLAVGLVGCGPYPWDVQYVGGFQHIRYVAWPLVTLIPVPLLNDHGKPIPCKEAR